MDFQNLAQNLSVLSDHALVQRLAHYFRHWTQNDWTLVSILVALAAGFVIGRYRTYRNYRNYHDDQTPAFQNRGEALLPRVAMTNFGWPDYHLMNHVTLQMTDGTTQVDHILVSRFGVFVIETKDYKGWIFANTTHENWTQVLLTSRYKFQNPIFQNLRHVRAVQSVLDFLPPGAIRSVVVFTGEAEFKTGIPDGVYSISGLIDYLLDQTVEVMSLNRMQFCVGRLETARLAISGQTDVEHVQSLDLRHAGRSKPRQR